MIDEETLERANFDEDPNCNPKSIKERERLRAVVDAYWSASNPGSVEFDLLRNHLTDLFGIQSPKEAHIRAVLGCFPERIIGIIIAWGFDDPLVAEEILEFLSRNQTNLMGEINPQHKGHDND